MKVTNPQRPFKTKPGIRILILKDLVYGYWFPLNVHPQTLELSFTTFAQTPCKMHQQLVV